jgi:hypothetical protein
MSYLARLLPWTEACSIKVQYDAKQQIPKHDKSSLITQIMPISKGSVKWRHSGNKKYVSTIDTVSGNLTTSKLCKPGRKIKVV